MGKLAKLYVDLDVVMRGLETALENVPKGKKNLEIIAPAFNLTDKLATTCSVSDGNVKDLRAVFKPKEKIVEFKWKKWNVTMLPAFQTYKTEYQHISAEWFGSSRADKGKKHKINVYCRFV